MNWHIYAWLNKGRARLEIVDAVSKQVQVRWEYDPNKEHGVEDKKEVQRLLKDLFLLTCKQEIHNTRVFHIAPIERHVADAAMTMSRQ